MLWGAVWCAMWCDAMRCVALGWVAGNYRVRLVGAYARKTTLGAEEECTAQDLLELLKWRTCCHFYFAEVTLATARPRPRSRERELELEVSES